MKCEYNQPRNGESGNVQCSGNLQHSKIICILIVCATLSQVKGEAHIVILLIVCGEIANMYICATEGDVLKYHFHHMLSLCVVVTNLTYSTYFCKHICILHIATHCTAKKQQLVFAYQRAYLVHV